jgi:hypothetical protein
MYEMGSPCRKSENSQKIPAGHEYAAGNWLCAGDETVAAVLT